VALNAVVRENIERVLLGDVPVNLRSVRRVFVFHHMFGRGEQFRELDQRGDALDAHLPQEGSAFFFQAKRSAP